MTINILRVVKVFVFAQSTNNQRLRDIEQSIIGLGNNNILNASLKNFCAVGLAGVKIIFFG